MKAYIKTYRPVSEFAKGKQPIKGKYSDRKSLFAYFVEYGEMNFGPFYSERSADNFLSNQGFKCDVDEVGLFYTKVRNGEVVNTIDTHYELYV